LATKNVKQRPQLPFCLFYQKQHDIRTDRNRSRIFPQYHVSSAIYCQRVVAYDRKIDSWCMRQMQGTCTRFPPCRAACFLSL